MRTDHESDKEMMPRSLTPFSGQARTRLLEKHPISSSCGFPPVTFTVVHLAPYAKKGTKCQLEKVTLFDLGVRYMTSTKLLKSSILLCLQSRVY